jgi:hypothetical protein
MLIFINLRKFYWLRFISNFNSLFILNNSIDPIEWRNNSIKGTVCGIMLCRNSPILQCPRCSLHYCSEHVKTHFHPSAEE